MRKAWGAPRAVSEELVNEKLLVLEQEHPAEEVKEKETAEEENELPKYSIKGLAAAFEDFNKLLTKF